MVTASISSNNLRVVCMPIRILHYLVTSPLELKVKQLRIIFAQDKLVRKVHGKLDTVEKVACGAAGGTAGGGVDTTDLKHKEKETATEG